MTKSRKRASKLPQAICFRITRDCNARCRFCLAPPQGEQPSATTLLQRINWLLTRGVTTIHFCGGEPTLHPALGQLLSHVHRSGGKNRLTTNGIAIADPLLPLLRSTATEVKVSLHGDQQHHNALAGVTSFRHTTRNINRLIAAGVKTSVQATVVAGQSDTVDWLIQFCLDTGIRRLSLLPFIPRGQGVDCSDEFALTSAQRRYLHDLIKQKRHSLSGRLDLRWLDFGSQALHVLETDGRLVLEAATETLDEVLCQVPERTI